MDQKVFEKKGSTAVSIDHPESKPDISIRKFLFQVLPQVSKELRRWNKHLENCEDWSLMRQGVSSLRKKKFHSQGGSFYALYNPLHAEQLTTLIVSLQTISDYLDNLCDRGGIYEEAAFRCLHHAMLDGINPHGPLNRDYYRFYPARKDGGYLNALIEECRKGVSSLPGYSSAYSEIVRLISLYSDLQVYKHLNPQIRPGRLKRWFREKGCVTNPPLYYWEFAAASGSTLAVFALFGAAASPHITVGEVKQIVNAYFPWICGLHILLDYWIDQEEDRIGGDFNFAACYPSPEAAANRLHLFLHKALEACSRISNPAFHRTIVHGLLAVYLSDPKVQQQGLQQTARSLLNAAGSEARFFHRLCLLLRRLNIL